MLTFGLATHNEAERGVAPPTATAQWARLRKLAREPSLRRDAPAQILLSGPDGRVAVMGLALGVREQSACSVELAITSRRAWRRALAGVGGFADGLAFNAEQGRASHPRHPHSVDRLMLSKRNGHLKTQRAVFPHMMDDGSTDSGSLST